MEVAPWDAQLQGVMYGANKTNETLCIEWVDSSFAECVQNWWGVLSVFVGYSSIGFWLFAQAPQLYLNFKNSNADSLALPFLVAWLIGDTSNFVGSMLSKQLASQIYTGLYFCIIDLVLFSQWMLYSVIWKKRERKNAHVQKVERDSKRNKYSQITLPAVGFATVAAGGLVVLNIPQQYDQENRLSRMLHTLDDSPVMIVRGQDIDPDAGYPFGQGSAHTTGFIIGIVSAFFYLVSRVPQIVKNYKRRSTGGLSFVMFLMAIMGNTTYALGVLMAAFQPYLYDGENPPNRISTRAFLMDKLPWLFGSVGTLFFDATIFFQFWYYGDKAMSVMEDSGGYIEENKHLLGDSGNITHEEQNPPRSKLLLGSPLFFPASKKSSSYQSLDKRSLR